MLLPLKAIILSKPRKDGNYVIYFQYCYSSTSRVLLSTELAIPKQYWNTKRQCVSKSLPVTFGDPEIMNNDISRIYKVIEAIIDHARKMDVPDLGKYVKELYNPKSETSTLLSIATPISYKNNEADFFIELEKFITTKKKSVCEASVRTFRVLEHRLKAFEEFRKRKITFNSIDYNLYDEMLDFFTCHYVLRRKKDIVYGLKTSSIGKTIKQFRMFIKDRIRRKIIPAIDLSDFKIIDEEADAIYLSYEEIGRIYNLPLAAHPTLEVYRDMFVFGCLTGLRFSDYSTLKKEDFRNGLLYKKTNKMDAWVVIPLRAEAATIFNKHFSTTLPKISNPVFNRNIKEIAQMAGITDQVTFSHKKGNKTIIETKSKSQWVTSHTCRRSFCTNEYLAGTDVSLIMKISGHKTFKEFFKYIRVTPEEAAHKIQAIWNERSKMQVFALPKVS